MIVSITDVPAKPSEPDAQRYALSIEYDGQPFCGWQRQHHSPSVQQALEEALSTVAAEPITVICSGRTDTGVHALSQIIHFDSVAKRELKAWVMGVNTLLPSSVAVRWAQPVTADFHARYSAEWRRYQYVIWNHRVRTPSLAGRVAQVRDSLDTTAMHEAAQHLLGEQDFSSFRAAGCQSNTAMRNVQAVSVERVGDFVVIDIRANAFLQHMVRNITGSLLQVGLAKSSVAWFEQLLRSRDRRQAAPTAVPNGLHFVEVGYPAGYNLPQERRHALPGLGMLSPIS